jgi:hypothetical protein
MHRGSTRAGRDISWRSAGPACTDLLDEGSQAAQKTQLLNWTVSSSTTRTIELNLNRGNASAKGCREK